MREVITAWLILATVFLVGLALVLFLNWALAGYELGGFCNLSDGSCYPK